MKVFISQPMRGLTDEEIKVNREKAENLIRLKYNDDVEFIDSLIKEDAPKDSNPGAYFLGRSIQLMSLADVVVFLPGYDKARGCIAEYNIAMDYEFDIVKIVGDYEGIIECKYIKL